MRVLILADASFAMREREMISRLELGLADEGVRVAHAVPRTTVDALEAAGRAVVDLFAQSIVYEPRGLPFGRAARLRRLVNSLSVLGAGDDERPVDVVHVLGDGAWSLAGDLASQTGAGLAVTVWSAPAAGAAARLRLPHPAKGVPPLVPVYLVPDPALESRLREELDRSGHSAAGVRLAPWGVNAAGSAHEVLRTGRAISIVIAGSGTDPPAYVACLDGLASVARTVPDLLIFADADVAARTGLMSRAQGLGLEDRFTLVPEVEARRELALSADLIVIPEALGEHRSLTLDAMASGAVVVAAEDPFVSYLADWKTSRLVPRPEAALWSAAIGELIDDHAGARSLAASAREYVRQNHRASGQVAAVLDAYEWMTGREPIPFEPRADS